MTEHLEWAFKITDGFSSPFDQLLSKLEKVERVAKRSAKQTEDVFAKAALRATRDAEKAAAAQTRAQERALAQQKRHHEQHIAHVKHIREHALSALGGAVGGQHGMMLGGLVGGGFQTGAAIGLAEGLIETVKHAFEIVVDGIKEVSKELFDHIKEMDAAKYALNKMVGSEGVELLDKFNAEFSKTISGNFNLLESIEQKLAFAGVGQGGKLGGTEDLARMTAVITELAGLKNPAHRAEEAQNISQAFAKFAATGVVRPSMFFKEIFGGVGTAAKLFGVSEKELRKRFQSGDVSPVDLVNRLSGALVAGRKGQPVGAGGFEITTKTVAGAVDTLHNTLQGFARAMVEGGMAERITAAVNKISAVFDPKSATGKMLLDAFTTMFEGVIDKVTKFLGNKEAVQDVVSTISHIIEMMPSFLAGVAKIVEIVAKVAVGVGKTIEGTAGYQAPGRAIGDAAYYALHPQALLEKLHDSTAAPRPLSARTRAQIEARESTINVHLHDPVIHGNEGAEEIGHTIAHTVKAHDRMGGQ